MFTNSFLGGFCYNKRLPSSILCLGATAILPLIAKAKEPVQHYPNIVLILADDLGYADLSCYGAKDIQTPNIDRLAMEGIRFTNFYASAGVSSPTRASIMTGCYPKRVDLHVGVLPPNTQSGLNPNEVTLAELLKKRGYSTACIGKWHLGILHEVLPTSQGFDYYYGMPGPNHGRSDLYRNTTLLKKNSEVNYDSITINYTEKAISYIQENKNKPFFLYLAHSAVHIPLFASSQFRRHEGKRGLYVDMTEELDWSVGRIYDELKNENLLENTIIIFVSDNGPYESPATPLHGGKGSTWEGGFRVPCIIRWSKQIRPNSINNELATVMDFLPTLVSIVGGELPNDRKIDGHDIFPLLTNKKAKSAYPFFCYYDRAGKIAAIRKGKWKLHLRKPDERWAGDMPVKEALLDQKPAEDIPWLYDLSKDVGETHNTIQSNQKIANQLRQIALDFDSVLTKEMRPAFKMNKNNP
jgi:arylsulfatase A-like enzyme